MAERHRTVSEWVEDNLLHRRLSREVGRELDRLSLHELHTHLAPWAPRPVDRRRCPLSPEALRITDVVARETEAKGRNWIEELGPAPRPRILENTPLKKETEMSDINLAEAEGILFGDHRHDPVSPEVLEEAIERLEGGRIREGEVVTGDALADAEDVLFGDRLGR